MNNSPVFSKREKAMIAIVAGICTAVMLMSVIALKTVLSTGATNVIQRETERIVFDNHFDDGVTPEATTVPEKNTAGEGETSAESDSINVENNSIISSEKAKKVAARDAGLDLPDVTFNRFNYEWDDGIQIYDMEFYSGDREYEYRIDAKSGKILDKSTGD